MNVVRVRAWRKLRKQNREHCGRLGHIDFLSNFLDEGISGSLGNCSELRTVLLYPNVLEDVIPAKLRRFRKLEVLDVSFLRGAYDSLEMLNLAQNDFTGNFPNQIGRCKKLHFLDLSSNNLTAPKNAKQSKQTPDILVFPQKIAFVAEKPQRRMKLAVNYFHRKANGANHWRDALELAEVAFHDADDQRRHSSVKKNTNDALAIDLNTVAPEGADA
ncbi:LRR receptor serine/threonine-protein kinase RPK2 [Spatholobus suberectus]|nr:LRR receptor serine/threonine-protein kinase RPK2 [Spatholobus suberectus]